jgi:phosphoadenosine phosphosulfate reductase
MSLDIEKINADLKGRSAEDIVRWALGLGKPAFTSTSFSPNSAVMLSMISRIDPNVPIVWVDSGYNMPDAYKVAETLIEKLNLNIRVYNPLMSAERRNALMGGIPHPDDNPELHKEFTRQVKLEPFQRALEELKPEVWLTGIRRNETEFRKTLDIVSVDNRGLLRVAPLFYWSEQAVEDYMRSHNLPTCQHYFDPTKISSDAECGLHTSA